MKRTIGIMMTALLLLAATGAKADDYRGTLERHGVKMEYAFSGGKVTNKKDPVYGGAPVLEMATFIDGEVEAGTKIKASCKKLKGLQKYKEVKIELIISKSNGQYKEDVKKGNDAQQVALGETLESVNGMLGDIESTVEGVEAISQGADTCESSKNVVIDTMSALSAISEENAASSEETGASMEELSATVTTLAGSASDLKKIAEQLNEDMKFFKS